MKRSTATGLAIGGVLLALWWKCRRKPIVAVTPGRGEGTHNVAVDMNGNPSPGPDYWLEVGPDGLRRWAPISALN